MVRKVVRAPLFKPKRADIEKPSAGAALGSFGLLLSKMISGAGQQGHLELRLRNKVPSSPLEPKYHIYRLQLLKMRVFIRLMTVDLVFGC